MVNKATASPRRTSPRVVVVITANINPHKSREWTTDLPLLLKLSCTILVILLLSLALLQQCLGDQDVVLGGNGTIFVRTNYSHKGV